MSVKYDGPEMDPKEQVYYMRARLIRIEQRCILLEWLVWALDNGIEKDFALKNSVATVRQKLADLSDGNYW